MHNTRRRFIHGLTLAGLTTAAGCAGISDSGPGGSSNDGGSHAEYSRWIPTRLQKDVQSFSFSHIDWDTYMSLFGTVQLSFDNMNYLRSRVPIIGFPLQMGNHVPQTSSVHAYPFTPDIYPKNDPGEGVNTNAISLIPDPVSIRHGSYDPDLFAEQYSRGFYHETHGGYDLYTRDQSDSGYLEAYAVSDSALVAAPRLEYAENPRAAEQVRSAIDTATGETSRLRETSDGDWLLRHAGEMPILYGFWVPNDETPLGTGDYVAETPAYDDSVFSEVTGVLCGISASVDGDTITSAEARFACAYTDADVIPTDDEIGNGLILNVRDYDTPGSVASEALANAEIDYGTTRDGNRLAVTADVTDELSAIFEM